MWKISSAGESFSNSTFQLDWSIGKCIIATHSAKSSVIAGLFMYFFEAVKKENNKL